MTVADASPSSQAAATNATTKGYPVSCANTAKKVASPAAKDCKVTYLANCYDCPQHILDFCWQEAQDTMATRAFSMRSLSHGWHELEM